jgi:hypothetical protein
MMLSRKMSVLSGMAVSAVLTAAVLFSTCPVQAQVACNQVGNHLIKIAKAQGTNQLVDCESARISKSKKHAITWQASGNDTLTIEFAAGQSPFLNFTCKDQKSCKATTIDPQAAAAKGFKYTVTLKSGGGTFIEDPEVVIDP